jgi:hypothetical protein
MFSHPVTKAGYAFIVIAILVIWLQPGNSFDTRATFLLFAYALSGVGPFLILLGVIAQGFIRVDETFREIASRKEPRTDRFKPLDLSSDSFNRDTEAELMANRSK